MDEQSTVVVGMGGALPSDDAPEYARHEADRRGARSRFRAGSSSGGATA